MFQKFHLQLRENGIMEKVVLHKSKVRFKPCYCGTVIAFFQGLLGLFRPRVSLLVFVYSPPDVPLL